MALMMGFPLAVYLMENKLRGRFSHLSPELAAELEAFAADQDLGARTRSGRAEQPEVIRRDASSRARRGTQCCGRHGIYARS